jgi:hypothetical protein
MGNMCATTRNKDYLLIAKSPHEIKGAFNDCITHRKCVTKKQLKKQQRKYTRKLIAIEEQLSDY